MRLYFSDGTFEDFVYDSTAKTDSEELDRDVEQFGAVLRERLGLDAERFLYGIISESRRAVEVYYTDGDGAYSEQEECSAVLSDTKETLEDLRKKLASMLDTNKISKIQLLEFVQELKEAEEGVDNWL